MAEIVIVVCVGLCFASASTTFATLYSRFKTIPPPNMVNHSDFFLNSINSQISENSQIHPERKKNIKKSKKPILGKCKNNKECPISKEEIEDPVILCTPAGLLYEKSYLIQWLTDHPFTDPSTNEVFTEKLKYNKYNFKKDDDYLTTVK